MMLKLHDRGKEVRELKSAMCLLGYLSQSEVNDRFDWNLKASLQLLQAHEGLEETGDFDVETKQILNKRLAQKG